MITVTGSTAPCAAGSPAPSPTSPLGWSCATRHGPLPATSGSASTPTRGGRRDQHRTFIRAATAAGVGHIVYTSFADASGVIRGPAGSGRVAAVARADVADGSVAAVTDDVRRVTGRPARTLEDALTQ